jgi:hypothetical protein
MSHDGSIKHAAACEQQLFWMQLPQAVPSLGHGNFPQYFVHCPVQHWAAVVHTVPSGWQTGGPQVPCALQSPEQQFVDGSHI